MHRYYAIVVGLVITFIPLLSNRLAVTNIVPTFDDIMDQASHQRGSQPTSIVAHSNINYTDNDEMQKCEQNVERIIGDVNCDPGKINKLRRRLAQDNPSCYRQTFPTFSQNFRHRLQAVNAHLNLHIPKTGGASLCELARLHKDTTNTTICWQEKYFYPVWTRGDTISRKGLLDGGNVTCDVYNLSMDMPEFVMNENYLDHPLCLTHRIYSVSLRNPIDRAMSHESHLYRFQYKINNSEILDHMMDLVRHDYMTWALSSGTNDGDRFSLTPTTEHLKIAKDTISRFDFLIDFSLNETCRNVTLKLMGFGNDTFAHAMVGYGKKFKHNLKPREQYDQWNLFDLELYSYAQGLMGVDCEFFLRLDDELDNGTG